MLICSREYYSEFIRPENKLIYTIENTIFYIIIRGINNILQKAKYVLIASTIELITFKQA